MAETKTMRYDKQKSIFTFPCGVKIAIEIDKLKWIFTLFKLTKEFETLNRMSAVQIPIGSARQIKNYLEKD